MAESGFLSEDGQSFVVTKEVSADKAGTKDESLPDDGEFDLKKVDISKIPEEHRKTFEKMATEIKDKVSKLDKLTDRADFADALRGLKEISSGSKPKAAETPAKKAAILPEFKFAEDDYYRQYIEPLAEALKKLDDRLEDLGGQVSATRASTFTNRVVSFIEREELSKEVVMKMDELAKSMGTGVYNDLPRLAKLAKIELGITLEKPKKREEPEPEPKNKRKSGVEMGSHRRGQSAKKPVNSILDAWNVAEEQLEQE